MDALALSRKLIRCASVTPADAGAIGILESVLQALGFTCHRLRFEEAGTAPGETLYARIGRGDRRAADKLLGKRDRIHLSHAANR